VFVDPPYRLTAEAAGRERLAAMAEALAALGCLAGGTLAMLRMEKGVPLDAPWPGFGAPQARTYGTTTLHLMEHTGTAG
jgi:16S rRNA G966 N2-methylase RsmD